MIHVNINLQNVKICSGCYCLDSNQITQNSFVTTTHYQTNVVWFQTGNALYKVWQSCQAKISLWQWWLQCRWGEDSAGRLMCDTVCKANNPNGRELVLHPSRNPKISEHWQPGFTETYICYLYYKIITATVSAISKHIHIHCLTNLPSCQLEAQVVLLGWQCCLHKTFPT